MLFASLDFLFFLALTFAGYWALAGRPVPRAAWCVAASYFFYVAGPKPVDGPLRTPWFFAGLLIASTLLDYTSGLRIQAARAARGFALDASLPRVASAVTESRAGKAWLLASVLGNLGLLAYFKYVGFLGEVVSDAAALVGVDGRLPVLRVLLPIGISFYTFQSLSYTIDVYRGRIPAERSLLRYAQFLSFFPQLVAGPIVRANELLPQLEQRPRLTRGDVDFALVRIAKGLVKKVLLGDFIAGSFTDAVFAAPAQYGSLENLLALYAFTLQIYADFSGYSDIAIGVARLFGVRLPENFNRPYQAVDVADFWRRWHITLSTWLRDYVYYPLGGSRLGAARTYLNLWVTMLLVGIWHGASWNFVVYALLQAFAMVFSRFVREESASALAKLARASALSLGVGLGSALLGSAVLDLPNYWAFGFAAGTVGLGVGLLPSVERWPALRPLHVLLTLHYCVLTRIFFRSESLDTTGQMARSLLDFGAFEVRKSLLGIEALADWTRSSPTFAWAEPLAEWGLLLLMIGGFVLHYLPARAVELRVGQLLPRVPGVVVGVGLALLLGALSLAQAAPRANIYFDF